MVPAFPLAPDLVDRIEHLPASDRLLLAEWIYAQAEPEMTIEHAWQAEAQRRLAAHRAAPEVTVPASTVFARWGLDAPGRL